MSNSVRSVICAVCLLAASAGICYWVATTKPLVESDYTTLNCTLKSADEKYAGKNSVYLEMSIAERPSIRFRVPADGYRESFNSDAFFANVKPGARVTFTVEKAELDNPSKPPLDPVPTVFVVGLKDDHATYSTLEGRKKWEATNKSYGYVTAIVMAVIGCGMGLMAFRAD
jgi:hypothetical protein